MAEPNPKRPEATGNSATFNATAAAIFRACAELLRQQNANPFRINAYQRAAQTLDALPEDARDILAHEGLAGLIRLPAIGQGLASSIDEIARTGRLSLLERLRGASDPETLFRTIPGIGPGLAHAIHETLHLESLEALELAAHDGRLERVPGIGPRRLTAMRAVLASLFGRRQLARRSKADGPSIGMLLEVDREYRDKAAAGSLSKIAPRRFNPSGEAWLPILHTQRNGWHFTILYSNTARAHQLHRTRDWVVTYFYDQDHQEGQHTIVTETHGALQGRRVVRGREADCAAFYGE